MSRSGAWPRAQSRAQSRVMSLLEAVTNVAVGYGLAVAPQLAVFPLFALPARLDDACAMGAVFSLVSLARSYLLRRMFEALAGRAA